jgi:hypothetical protein
MPVFEDGTSENGSISTVDREGLDVSAPKTVPPASIRRKSRRPKNPSRAGGGLSATRHFHDDRARSYMGIGAEWGRKARDTIAAVQAGSPDLALAFATMRRQLFAGSAPDSAPIRAAKPLPD